MKATAFPRLPEPLPPTPLMRLLDDRKPVVEKPYDVKEAAARLDALRLAVRAGAPDSLPDNLMELPPEIYHRISTYSRYRPAQEFSLEEYSIGAARELLDKLELKGIDLDHCQFDTLDGVFSFVKKLNVIVADVYFETLKDTLKDAFQNSCNTDQDKERMLRAALNELGYSAATVHLEPSSTPAAAPAGPPLPETAPELYASRSDRREKPPEFIKRVYGPWLGKGLDRPTLLKLDKQLYHGLNQWRLRYGLPDGFELPTKRETVDREVERLGPDAIREAGRLARAGYSRNKITQKDIV